MAAEIGRSVLVRRLDSSSIRYTPLLSSRAQLGIQEDITSYFGCRFTCRSPQVPQCHSTDRGCCLYYYQPARPAEHGRYPPTMANTVIIGSGLMGLSTAFHLSESPRSQAQNIHLVEASPELFHCASGLGGGFLAEDCWQIPRDCLLSSLLTCY